MTECDKIGEEALQCNCNHHVRLQIALSSLKMGLITLNDLGYHLVNDIEFERVKVSDDN